MPHPTRISSRYNKPFTQRGGITILVVLMLLVLMTVIAMAMSRNSMREIVVSGTSRQGAMARNDADSGIEYGILWMQNPTTKPAPSGTPAEKLQVLTNTLLMENRSGKPYTLDGALCTGTITTTPPAELQVPASSGNGFNLALTYMGPMPNPGTSQTQGSVTTGNTLAAGTASSIGPVLFAVRSDGQVNAGGVMTFLHSKEAWISIPTR